MSVDHGASVASVVQNGAALAAGILVGDLIVRALRWSRQLLPAEGVAEVEATRREKVRCVYYTARMPLQWLFLSGVLPVQKQ